MGGSYSVDKTPPAPRAMKMPPGYRESSFMLNTYRLKKEDRYTFGAYGRKIANSSLPSYWDG